MGWGGGLTRGTRFIFLGRGSNTFPPSMGGGGGNFFLNFRAQGSSHVLKALAKPLVDLEQDMREPGESF